MTEWEFDVAVTTHDLLQQGVMNPALHTSPLACHSYP